MFMASYTANYGLHQWEAADNFLRTDFNTDFGIIDTALGEKAEMVTGYYVGNEVSGRIIQLGATPRAVIIKNVAYSSVFGHSSENYYVPSIATPEVTTGVFTIVEGGFQLTDHGLVNANNYTFRYLAFM